MQEVKFTAFFSWVFGDEEGYVAIGYKVRRTGAFTEFFFHWPTEQREIESIIEDRYLIGDIYFCPTLLREPKRKKQHVTSSRVVWADLDECPPENMLIPPSAIVQTSIEKTHAYWLLDKTYPALDVEEINKRIAYFHADEGCDKSGWDLTQYLRVPKTRNHKYEPHIHPVQLTSYTSDRHALKAFDVYPAVEVAERLRLPMPSTETLFSIDPNQVLLEVQGSVNPRVWRLATEVPGVEPGKDKADWSKAAWQLELSLFDAGRTREEVFAVLWNAVCNKYERDRRDNAKELLWAEVLRAEETSKDNSIGVADIDDIQDVFYVPKVSILTDKEREACSQRVTIIEEYINWAKTVGDAAIQYHEAGAFVILSSLLSGSVKLETSYGVVMPNLWFMILADTTLTRKTTAMDLAMDILVEIDADCILATDGSIEGLMTTLSMRPGKPSVFLRDEFSGLLDAVSKRDYYAGMLETLTKLYDGKLQKRVLRKETIQVRNPCLILFTGGIKERIYSLLGPEHINSGFVPRFCFITAESDIMQLRPLGPPTEESLTGREYLLQRYTAIYNHYNNTQPPPVNSKDTDADDQVVDFRKTSWKAQLTPEAWKRYNEIEQSMLETGLNSSVEYLLTPVMARLSISGLKAALLLAASEKLHTSDIVVELRHIQQAFYYVERWKTHVLNVIANAGKTATEKELERIVKYIGEFPEAPRGKIMQRFHLTARQADAIFATLLQRGVIRVEKGQGKQETYYPIRPVPTSKVSTKGD